MQEQEQLQGAMVRRVVVAVAVPVESLNVKLSLKVSL
tara:strand:+ start:444 stop:554 length:111 start_codon:yes stop_codon:yes gene_type:complete